MFSGYQEHGIEEASKYTHRMNIWQMEYIIIPVHLVNHWLAIIIANPGGVLTADDDS